MLKNRGTTGFYCLANDVVSEWVIALLESIRAHEPRHQFTIIPFDDRIERLRALSQKYGFGFFEDKNLLSELDRIGGHFSDEHFHVHVFRKFAAFWGSFDHFIFVDCDVIFLLNPEELFKAYLSTDCDFMGNDPDMDQVYKPGAFREKMISDYSANAFNAGCFLSSQNAFSFAEIEAAQKKAQPIKESFSLVGGEQPFLNYCVHTKRLKYRSFADVVSDLSLWTWANQQVKRNGNSYRLVKPGNSENGKRMPYIHWSGLRCNRQMPNRKIFLTYRLNNSSWLSRIQYRCASLFDWWNKGSKPVVSRRAWPSPSAEPANG